MSTATGTAMASLVSSLADNKAALGRRYGEWAISAPTLESAVAAAAMAQDELGHSRSTYPVLKQLGVDANEDGFGGDKRLALLDEELQPIAAATVATEINIPSLLVVFIVMCIRARSTPAPRGRNAPLSTA